MGLTLITTVTVGPTSRRLTTKEHVRDDLQITTGADDVYLDRLITSQSQAAENYCNRVFAVDTRVDTYFLDRDRSVRARDSGTLLLSKRPVVSIASLTENGTTLTANSDYVVDTDTGEVIRLDASSRVVPWNLFPVVITYSAGYTLPAQGKDGENCTLPADIEEAVIRMVKSRYLARDRDPFLKQESIPGVLDQTFWVDTGESGNISPDIRDLLDNYREPVVA